MIEVELKLEVKQLPNISNLELISEKRVVDIYYDTKDYKFISTGNFLRNRNNKNIDFKLELGDMSHCYCKETNFKFDNFTHCESIEQIFNKIGVPYNSNFNSFEQFLSANKLIKLATIDKHRKEYKLDNYIVSVDDAKDIGKFVEIECDLPDGSIFDKNEIRENMLNALIKNGVISEYKKVSIGYVEL